MESRMSKRLTKDLESIQKNYKEIFDVSLPQGDLKLWHIKFTGAKETIFAGEKFTLQFKFGPEYPIEAPEVLFIGKGPEHEHIYSNGFICLSILYDEWSAALTVSSVCMSILSMLSSAKHKARPFNDAEFCKRAAGKSPKNFLWSYDDNKC